MNLTMATVHDLTLSQLRRKQQRGAQVESEPQAATIFSDMSDGILALDYGLSFAAFEHKARKLVLHVVSLIGDSNEPLTMTDEEIASYIRCRRETVVRWRQAHKQEVLSKRFAFLIIVEGEYNSRKKLYEPTSYKLNPHVREFVEAAVNRARQSPLYKQDRKAALEATAAEAYDDMPDAPNLQKLRRGRPRRKDDKSVLKPLEAARKAVMSSKMNLQDMNNKPRQKFLFAQGSDIRQKLLEMQAEITAYLTMLPETVETIADSVIVNDPCDFRSHPPVTFDHTPSGEDECHIDYLNTTVTSDFDDKLDSKAMAAWDQAFGCLNRPQVQVVEIELHGDAVGAPEVADPPQETQFCGDETLGSYTIVTQESRAAGGDFANTAGEAALPAADPPDEIELAERIAIMIENGTLEPEAERLARVDLGFPARDFSSATERGEGTALVWAAPSPAFGRGQMVREKCGECSGNHVERRRWQQSRRRKR
jgi:hypothetical protein